MRTLLTATAVAALILTVTACGGDSDGGGGDLSEAQSAAVDAAMDQLDGEDGLSADRSCIEGVAAKLSDEDARAIVEAGDGDADLSDEGEALSVELFGCLDFSGLIDQMVEEAEASGLELDRGCLESFFEDLGNEAGALMASEGEMPDDMMAGLFECMDMG